MNVARNELFLAERKAPSSQAHGEYFINYLVDNRNTGQKWKLRY